jgi:hypothetical protein
MKKLYVVLLALTGFYRASSQGEIPVDMYTGTPHIQIPIANIGSHDLSEMVSLSYNAKGIRPSESNGIFGLSWELNAGARIYREVRGLPDDFKGAGSSRRGWLHKRPSRTTTISEEIGAFANSADTSASTCSDEVSDYDSINNYAYTYDTEPDIFHYSLGGVSGSFVFDNSSTPTIRLIPYQDIKIEPIHSSSTLEILGFKITTNTGIIYTFGIGRYERRFTESLHLEDTIEFNKTEYQLYSNHIQPYVDFYSQWKVEKIKSPSGDSISYSYQILEDPSRQDVNAIIYNATTFQYETYPVYWDSTYSYTYQLQKVEAASGASLELIRPDRLVTAIAIKDQRLGSDYSTSDSVKIFVIEYLTQDNRSLIQSIMEISETDSLPPYEFDYYYSYLPPADTKSTDFWGYYNGQNNATLAPTIYVYPNLPAAERFRLEEITGYAGTHYTIPGANRKVDPSFIQVGTLKTITYPAGGISTINYEANTYYDTIANQEYYGGGLRIKSMTYFDGLNPDAKIKKTFEYKDDSGKTTGRLVSKPAFAFVTWKYKHPESNSEIMDEEDPWTFLLVRSEFDLGDGPFKNGCPIGYKQVTVRRGGAGYATYRYHLPGEYGEATNGEWLATMNKFARDTSCAEMKLHASGAGINAFPFAPNPNFDHERGLVKTKLEYNDEGALVRKTDYTYQYLYKTGSAAEKVWGLRYEKYPNSTSNIFLYGKYFFLTNVSRPVAKEVVTTYDSLDYVSASTEYFYESTYHKLLTRIKAIAIDSTIQQTYLRYPLDYGTIPSGSDKASEMIGDLQTQFRHGVPVERYQTIQWYGETEKVVGGSVVKFNDFGTSDNVLPEYHLDWRSATPEAISSFVPSYVHPTSKTFITDNQYEVVNTMTDYADFDKPSCAIGEGRIPSATLWNADTGTPVVVLQDATPDQVAFSDFELNTSGSFSTACINCDPFYQLLESGARTGHWAINPNETKIFKTLEKGESTYRLSGWYNNRSETLQVHVVIKNAAKTTTYYNNTFTVTFPDTTGYEYFEREIPIDNGLSQFYVEINMTSSGDWHNSVPVALVDDIGFFPVSSSFSTTTYKFPHGPSSVTSGDKTMRTVYDGLGRVIYLLDKDNNYLQRNSYHVNEQ